MFIWLGRNPREAAASVPRSRDVCRSDMLRALQPVASGKHSPFAPFFRRNWTIAQGPRRETKKG